MYVWGSGELVCVWCVWYVFVWVWEPVAPGRRLCLASGCTAASAVTHRAVRTSCPRPCPRPSRRHCPPACPWCVSSASTQKSDQRPPTAAGRGLRASGQYPQVAPAPWRGGRGSGPLVAPHIPADVLDLSATLGGDKTPGQSPSTAACLHSLHLGCLLLDTQTSHLLALCACMWLCRLWAPR